MPCSKMYLYQCTILFKVQVLRVFACPCSKWYPLSGLPSNGKARGEDLWQFYGASPLK